MPWSSFFEYQVLSQLFTLLLHLHQGAVQFLLDFCYRVVSSAYLRLLIFLLSIWILACDSSSLAFCMIYSTYKLNKQVDSIYPWYTPFPILNHSVVPCPVLTFASWPAYRSSQEAGKVVWYSHLFKNFPQLVVIHTVKGFSIVSEAEVDIFLKSLCILYDPVNVGSLIPLPFLNPTCISGSSWYTYC